MDKSDLCPHDCTQCGSPCYIPFAGNPKCTNLLCQWFDLQTYRDHIMSLPDPGDPVGHQDNGPFAGNPKWLYRDFCGSCHVPVEFTRAQYDDGRYGAWCPQCGEANYWEADEVEDEDTQPGAPSPLVLNTGASISWGRRTSRPLEKEEIQDAIREFLDTPIDKD